MGSLDRITEKRPMVEKQIAVRIVSSGSGTHGYFDSMYMTVDVCEFHAAAVVLMML